MTTETHVTRRPVIQQTRVHDYLYDRDFHVASERDHARATFQAHTNVSRIKRVPIFKQMFSELRHKPRFQVQLDLTDPVPTFVSRQWPGYHDQARDDVIRYKSMTYDPAARVPHRDFGDQNVSGQNHYKFFTRPIIPYMQHIPPDVVLASARQDPLAAAAVLDEEMNAKEQAPKTRTVCIQTDYRDESVQTDPYSPDYVIKPGVQPELLTLATLSYGCGLPAGLAEVEMIERARAKRAWEATLPPLSDVTKHEKRKRMMEDMEHIEWRLREQEIEKLQEARLQMLKRLLRQREEHHQELNSKRLDRLWAKKQEEKDAAIKKIRNNHIKAIRKMTIERKTIEGGMHRRDIVSDYSDYASQVYAPLARIGVFLDRGSEQYVVKSRYLSSYQGLLELENALPDFVTQPRVKAPKPRVIPKQGYVRRKYRRERELAEIYDLIKEQAKHSEEPPKALRYLQKIEKPIPRPPTPTVTIPDNMEEERELAVIFLQQLIRGRAVQNMMYEGKEKRSELIQELRSTHSLQYAEQQMQKQERLATLALQRQRRLHEHKESIIDKVMSELEGESLGDMLDFLSKELIRLQEERRIHAFAMLAERQRRIREAEESGWRQMEERRRREEDELFKQVIKVHQMSVDTYLENVILESLDRSADDEARVEIQQYARKINDIAYKVESSRTDLESEEIVSELVHSFLIPEAQKQSIRQKVHQQQRKHLLAAHREIHQMGEEVITAASPDAEGASMEGEATELPTHRHRMSFRKSSVPDPTTTSTDDSSLENMFLAIEEQHRPKHASRKSTVKSEEVGDLSLPTVIEGGFTTVSSTEVSQSSSSASSSDDDDDDAGSTNASSGSTSSEEYYIQKHLRRGTTLVTDDKGHLKLAMKNTPKK